jgi:hypothetical protein
VHGRYAPYVAIDADDVDGARIGQKGDRQLRDGRKRVLVVQRCSENAARLGEETQ